MILVAGISCQRAGDALERAAGAVSRHPVVELAPKSSMISRAVVRE
jgi:hypothetical protein